MTAGNATGNNPMKSMDDMFNSILGKTVKSLLFSTLEQVYNFKEVLSGPLFNNRIIRATMITGIVWHHPMTDYDAIPIYGFFGDRGGLHKGIDFLNPLTPPKPIYAAADGTVIDKKTSDMYGHSLIIQHNNEYQTRYCNLDRFAVSVNDVVSGGTIIGYCGNTGSAIRNYLHFEVRKGSGLNIDDSIAVDPQLVINNLIRNDERTADTSLSNISASITTLKSIMQNLFAMYITTKQNETDNFNEQAKDHKIAALAGFVPSPQLSYLCNRIATNDYLNTFIVKPKKPNIFNIGTTITYNEKISTNFVWGDVVIDDMRKLDEALSPPDEVLRNMKTLAEGILEPLLTYPGYTDSAGQAYPGINNNKQAIKILRGWQSEDFYTYLNTLGVKNDPENDHIKGLAIDFQVLGADHDDLALWCQSHLEVRKIALYNWQPYYRGGDAGNWTQVQSKSVERFYGGRIL